ncbi:unnamed protein product, partial [Ectocarpus sp. 13 AM-2016]
KIPRPQLWTAERPHLYTLVVSMHRVGPHGEVDEEEAPLQCESSRIEISGGQLRVNGRAITVAGANRHEHDDSGGKVVPLESMVRDALVMKRHNFNAVRTSHYPNHPFFYEVCDRLGLYVVDEANIETHGMEPTPSRLTRDPDWQEAHIERLKGMVERDKNHPSIISWSLGNEAGLGAAHYAMSKWLRVRDPSRIIMYEPAMFEGSPPAAASLRQQQEQEQEQEQSSSATDVICPMYARVEECVRFLQEDDRKLAESDDNGGGGGGGGGRPLILCEYSHAMGNSNGNLHKYWELFRSNPRCQGGFVWDWVDQGLRKSIPGPPGGPGGVETWGYGGDFGEPVNDGNFCVNGVVWPDRTPHPAMEEFKYLMQPFHASILPAGVTTPATRRPSAPSPTTVTLSIANRYDFTDNLWDVLVFGWHVEVDGVVVARGDDLSPSSPPPPRSDENDREPGATQDQGGGDDASGFPAAAGEGGGAGAGRVTAATLTFESLPSFTGGVEKECWLTVTGRLRAATAWAPAGHKVGHVQLELPRSPESGAGVETSEAAAAAAAAAAAVTDDSAAARQELAVVVVEEYADVDGGGEMLTVSVPPPDGGGDGGIRAVFDMQSGRLSQLQLLGGDEGGTVDLLEAVEDDDDDDGVDGEDEHSRRVLGLQFNRAPTDNDRGGYVGRWDVAGLLGPALGPFGACSGWERREADGAVLVTTEFKLRPRAPKPRLCKLFYKV